MRFLKLILERIVILKLFFVSISIKYMRFFTFKQLEEKMKCVVSNFFVANSVLVSWFFRDFWFQISTMAYTPLPTQDTDEIEVKIRMASSNLEDKTIHVNLGESVYRLKLKIKEMYSLNHITNMRWEKD